MPGHAGGWIAVRDAVKKPLPKDAPLPGKFRVHAEARPWRRRPKRRRESDAMKFDMTSMDGSAAGSLELSDAIFGLERARPDRAHGALAARQAPGGDAQDAGPRRHPSHRQEDYKQKGTGGAGHGSARVPQFRGGGAPWAPSFAATNTTCRRRCGRLRLRHALSAKVRARRPCGVGKRSHLEEAKTKTLRVFVREGGAQECAHHRRRRAADEVRPSRLATCRRSTCCRSRASTSTTLCVARSWF